ncbi:hypothetical protein IAR55_004039 [Kwoniella newhampshirensis]|uniref:Protein kinase domain-containing protein n=1 Tax=Kwoniella newhampshirensis TaxID=1651941 RepID=A0AAW0Z195_9TREE
MNAQTAQAGSSKPYPRQSSANGYPEHVLEPAYAGWSNYTSAQLTDASNFDPMNDNPLQPPPLTPRRERVASSASISSMSSTVRGRRAPAPAALDLSPRNENKYGDIVMGQVKDARRVVTEPVHQTEGSLHLLPMKIFSPRELATPRWGASTSHQHLRTPSMPSELSSSSLGPQPSDKPWGRSQEGFGLGLGGSDKTRFASDSNTPPRPPTKSPAREQPRGILASPNSPSKDDSLFSLGSLADFNFDTSMEATLAASLSAVTTDALQPQSNPTPSSPPAGVLPASPGSARSRIYARRQERAAAAAAIAATAVSQNQPTTSIDPHISAQRAGRESRKTPPNTSRHSTSHDILKQFAVKDFSHLPPSPSSASINQFLRGSGSVSNFAASTPPTSASATNSAFNSKTIHQSESQRLKTVPSNPKISRDVDPSTAEALRKLDGLTSTPNKAKTRNKIPMGAAGIHSLPGSPPEGRPPKPKLATKQSNSSLKTADSPLNTWIDIGEPVPLPRGSATKRESSSSTSFVGTPTSRDSHSLPTNSTTPSSGDGISKPRRASAGSDMSTPSINMADTVNEESKVPVPPVPPLPKGYVSMRQGLVAPSFAPVQDATSESPFSSTLPLAPPKMHKKWSFSSALNLKTTASPVPSSEDGRRSPQTPWSEIRHGELLSPALQSHGSSESVPQSTTPVAIGKPHTAAKRLTPSSIPFFRRTSSSSTQGKPAIQPQVTPKSMDTQAASGQQSRKSVLGMHLPSMLRSSNSKRGISQQLNPAPTVIEAKVDQPASTGWTGRKRGKTLSISGDFPIPKPTATMKHQSSFERSLTARSSATSSQSESTVNGALDNRLPAIMGSPARATGALRQSGSSRDLPSITPTKIPRMASRPGVPSPAAMAMPPPSLSSARGKTLSGTSSMAELTRPFVSEFGVVDGAAPRQSTSGAHRAHLLAPMSTRQDSKRMMSRPSEPPARHEPAPGIPPSRRQLPRPPSSTITAMTVSASNKRTSRESRSGRRDSKEVSQDGTSSGRTSPIKPSKSLHSKLAIPSTSKMSASSSVGAPGAGFRKVSLTAESPSMSPADDEESLADAEMAAYIRRRRQRAAHNKKDDLSDVNEFPEDVSPAEPMSQRAFVTRYFATMTDVERKEILDFDQIYYAPPPSTVGRPLQAGGASYNHGYDDERGDYLVVERDHLCYRYEVIGILGKGSFGQVVQCRDHKTGGSVAVKIIRNKKRFHSQALVEVKILEQLVEWVSFFSETIH